MWTSSFPVISRLMEGQDITRGSSIRPHCDFGQALASLGFVLTSQLGSSVTTDRKCSPQRSHRVGKKGPSGLGVWGQKKATHS